MTCKGSLLNTLVSTLAAWHLETPHTPGKSGVCLAGTTPILFLAQTYRRFSPCPLTWCLAREPKQPMCLLSRGCGPRCSSPGVWTVVLHILSSLQVVHWRRTCSGPVTPSHASRSLSFLLCFLFPCLFSAPTNFLLKDSWGTRNCTYFKCTI